MDEARGPPHFGPLEFVGHPSIDAKTGFVGQSVYPRPTTRQAQDPLGYRRAPLGAAPFSVPPSSGPSVWASPFGAAVAALGASDSQSAFAAAAEAESRVRQGIAAAQHWWPATIDELRKYFAVSHSSIGQKLLSLLIPIFGNRRFWKAFSAGRPSKSLSSDVIPDSGDHIDHKVHNIHHLGPDLYLPLMSFLTYVLLYGLSKATFEDFHPEVLSTTASFGAVVTVIEVIISFTAFYLMGVHLPVLDVVSVAGQKFESLVAILLSVLLIGKQTTLYWGVFLYFGICAAHACFQSLKECELRHRSTAEWGPQKGRPPAFLYVLLVICSCQIPLCWLMTPSFSSTPDGGVVVPTLGQKLTTPQILPLSGKR